MILISDLISLAAAILPRQTIIFGSLIRDTYGSKLKVYDADIPRSVRAAEISAEGVSIFKHDPGGKVAEAYRSLTKEVLQNAEKRRKHQLDQLR